MLNNIRDTSYSHDRISLVETMGAGCGDLALSAGLAAGADVIICGAGLPTDLPELVEGTDAAIAPIVSGKKAAELIVRMWTKKYNRLPDFFVVEGPKAGGHLGFKPEQLEDTRYCYYLFRNK